MLAFNLLHRVGSRFDLMKRMMAKTGVDETLATLPGSADVINRAQKRCGTCGEPQACAHWLEEASAGAAPPAYCRNLDLIERLKQATTV